MFLMHISNAPRLASYVLTAALLVCLPLVYAAAQQQTRERRVTGSQSGDQSRDQANDDEQGEGLQQDTSLTEVQKQAALAEAERLDAGAVEPFRRGEYVKALSLELEALKLRIRVLGREHYLVGRSIASMALTFHKAGREDIAAESLQKAMLVYKKLIALAHNAGDGRSKAHLLFEAGEIHAVVGQYQQAHDYLTFAVVTYRKIHDPEGEKRAREAAGTVAVDMREAAESNVPAPGKPETVMQTGHGSSPALAFSPDGRLLATGASDDTVRLWDAATGRVLRNLYGARGPVAFSRDGRWLLTGDLRGLATLWDVATGERQEMRTIPYEGTYTVFDAAFSPDGRSLVTAHGDGAVSQWDIPLRIETGTIGMHGAARHDEGHVNTKDDEGGGLLIAVGNRLSVEGQTAHGVAFSPDGRIIASCGEDKTVKLWDEATGALLHTLPAAGSVHDLAFSPDGRRIASVDGDIKEKTLRIWEVATGRMSRAIKVESQNIVVSVAFSPDGRLLAAGSADMVRVWDAATGRELRSLSGAHGDVEFSPDGRLLATGGGGFQGRQITFWDVATGRAARTLDEDAPSVGSVAFSPDGRWLATQGGGSLMFWEIGSGHAPVKLGGDGTKEEDSIGSFVLSPDGLKLAAASDGKVRVLSLGTGRELYTLKGGPDQHKFDNHIYEYVFSPDGRLLATGESDGTVKLWDAGSGRELRTVATAATPAPPEKSAQAAPTPGQKKNRVKELWDSFKDIVPGNAVRVLVFSPDGKLLASVDSENEVKVYAAATGRLLRSFSAYNKEWGNGVGALTFSPDGRHLATGDVGGSIRIWDAATGAAVRRMAELTPLNAVNQNLSNPNRQLSRLIYRSDGNYLASVSTGGRVNVWETATGRKALTLAARTGTKDFDWSRDGRFFVTSNYDGAAHLWDGQTGELLASLMTVGGRGDWLVVSPDGLFDGTPPAWKKILWRFSPETFDVQPVEAFFNEFYHPGLLDDIMLDRRPRAAQGIAQKDRRQPQLKIELAGPTAGGAPLTSREVRVRIEVTEAPAVAARAGGGGARDVRLFRNGSLVEVWRGDLELRGGKTVVEATVPIVAGENSLTAYAFNRDNIKSGDATLTVKGAESLRRKGTLYVVAVGVNAYANSAFNLKYAVPDALAFASELSRQQGALNLYARVETITLLDREATKENILALFKRLSGGAEAVPPPNLPPSLARIGRAQPEDSVVIYFAGHGTAQQDRFYLIPHDLGYAGGRTAREVSSNLQTILRHGVSDVELERAFEGIDAERLLLVIDACNSGQALEAEEKRRGPMNSRGLAQMAYEKGMYVLTAAQSYQVALGAGRLGHGYLTYALVEEGLKSSAADKGPTDGQVYAREWLDYAADRVPEMQREQLGRGERREVVHGTTRAGAAPGADDVQHPRVFYRREPEAQPFVITRATGGPPPQRADLPRAAETVQTAAAGTAAVEPKTAQPAAVVPPGADTSAADRSPHDFAAQMRAADSLRKLNDYEREERYLRRALAVNPGDARARTDLGNTYLRRPTPDYDRAIAEYRRALIADPRYEEAWQNLAAAALLKRSELMARDAIKQLEALNPSHPSLPRLRAGLGELHPPLSPVRPRP